MNYFVSAIVNKIEEDGLKCKVIERKIDDMDNVRAYFFIYENECEEMNKMIQYLEKSFSM